GAFRCGPGWRSTRLGCPLAYWRVALVDDEPLTRLVTCLRCCAVDAYLRPCCGGAPNRKPLRKVEIRSLGRLAIVHALITAERDSRSYRRGFLAGFFDAEGHSAESLRISQVDLSILDRVRRYAFSLGFNFQLELRPGKARTLRLVGRLIDRIRFFSVCRPAISRELHGLFGREMNLDPEPVQAIEPGPPTDVVDIQTSTRTFYAAGLATHNCYARPTHEYLGFSAGLDFERRILVKENAPELLREALAAPRWEPQVVALSGNTDCYQPIPRILAAAAGAGARSASWVLLRLPKPVDELFQGWLAEHYPERRARVLARIREVREGRLSDARFFRRQRGQGEYAAQIAALFAVAARKHGLDGHL